MRTALTLTWFLMAAWFLWGWGADGKRERIPTARVSAEDIAPVAPRATLSDPPRVKIGGVEQKCSDCHALFASLDVTPSQIRQHTHIALDHGMNDRCYNCHAQHDRNKLVMHDGSLVGFSESTTLCSKCHGTVFRDWERGMHGRTSGSWDASSGLQVRLGCAQCHDPHSPAFDDIVPLPGPRGPQFRPRATHQAEPHTGIRNPLERWKERRDGHASAEEKQ